MEIPDDITTSFDLLVKPGAPVPVAVPSGAECVITNATLDVADESSGRSVVFIKNGGSDVALFPLTVGQLECVTTDLHFNEGSSFTLYLGEGAVPVHVSGYLTGAFRLETAAE